MPQVPHLLNRERKALSSQASSLAQSRWGSRCPQAGPGPARLCDVTPGCYGSSQKAARDAAALASPCLLVIRGGICVTWSHGPMRRWSRGRAQPELQREGRGRGRIKLRQVILILFFFFSFSFFRVKNALPGFLAKKKKKISGVGIHCIS